MMVCLYFYCKATSESKDFEVVFGEWAKWVGGNLKGVVDEFNGCHECTNFFKLKTNFK